MIYKYTKILVLLGGLAGCSLDATDSRVFDPDAEFAKLDQPEIPTVESSLLKSARYKEEQGQYEEAASLYAQLIDTNPDNLDYQLALAETVRRNGDNEEAITLYDPLLNDKKVGLDALEGKALAVMARGEFKEASTLFEQIVRQDGTRWRTLNALAIMFTLKDLHEEAMAYYTEALKNSPNNASVLNNIGLSSAIARQYATSLEYLDKAAKTSRNDAAKNRRIELNKALVHGVSGDLQMAERVASRHLKGALLQNNLGLYAHLANNDELAKSYLNMALSQSPSFYKNAWENLDYLIGQGKGAGRVSSGTAKRVRVE